MNKAKIKGPDADPEFMYLKQNAPELQGEEIPWNFAKFLLDANGNVVHYYDPHFDPNGIISDI